MAFTRPALNPQEPLIETDRDNLGKPSKSFLIYSRDQRADIDASPATFPPVRYTARTSAIGTTAIPTDGDLSAGLYRVSWAAKVVTVAGVSSDFRVTIAWTWRGVSQTWVGTLRNGNLTTTYDLDSVPLFYIDAATPVTFAVAYNSNPAATMAYDFLLSLERLAAL